LKIIGRACLKQALRNKPALIKGDPEGVHQTRVGLRRLRTAMSLFGELLQDPQSAAIKSELKWLAAELAPARDLDVLTKRVATGVKKQHERWQGVPSLLRELAEEREAALAPRAERRDICPFSRTDARDRGVAGDRRVDQPPR